MIIESMIRENKYCSIVAYTPEHVYNAWMRLDTVHFYVLSNDKKADVLYYFVAHIDDGEIQLLGDEVALKLYSHDELINFIHCVFTEDCHDVVTILDTLLYLE